MSSRTSRVSSPPCGGRARLPQRVGSCCSAFSRPGHTGYGYIRSGDPLAGFDDAFAVDAFMEKPDRETAAGYLKAGGHFWNSGIFVFRAQTFLDELARLDPSILDAAKRALAEAREDLGFLRLGEAFAKAPAISIDYAVMEKTKTAAVLPIDIGWSDVGSWSSLWEIAKQDADGNAVRGQAILEDTSNSYVHSERALVATIGVENLYRQHAGCAAGGRPRQGPGRVGYRQAPAAGRPHGEQVQHLRSYRPWGYFELLSIAPRFQVKLLHVKPGGKLSMQMHHHRSEHWVVVHGTAKVTISDAKSSSCARTSSST